MSEPRVLINPRKGNGDITRCDVSLPLSACRPGARIKLPVDWGSEDGRPLKIAAVVREVSFRHRWILMEIQARGEVIRECVKFTIEGE